jgi:retinol dehydrogenase-12
MVLNITSGVMAPPIELVTADGYDLQFGTNVLGEKLGNHVKITS